MSNWFSTKVQKELGEGKISFSTNVAPAIGQFIGKKKMKPSLNLPPFIKINSKWIMNLNIKHKAFRRKKEKIFRI